MESTTALQQTPTDRIRKPLIIVGTIVLSLIPCLWPPRLVSGDLPSHVYNAWLTQLLEQGRITGLHLTHPFGNILVDLILVRMLPCLGPTGAARALGILVVSTFFWGGMFLSWKIAARNVWHLAPLWAMLTYGFIFYMGFMNFLLGLGTCLFVLGLLWRPTRSIWFWILPLIVLAVLAHPMPVVATAGIALYVAIAKRLEGRWRALWFVMACAVLTGLRFALCAKYACKFDALSILTFTGAGSAHVYGPWFEYVAWSWLGLALLMLLPLREAIPTSGAGRALLIQVWGLCAFAASALPNGVLGDQSAALYYMTERWSLMAAIAVIVLIGLTTPRRSYVLAALVLLVAYFSMLYRVAVIFDQKYALEERTVASIPAGSLTAHFVDPVPIAARGILSPSRISWAHMVDMACIGRCFSYFNYEPVSGHFRLRVDGDSPYIFSDEQMLLRPRPLTVRAPVGKGFFVIGPCARGTLDLCVSQAESIVLY